MKRATLTAVSLGFLFVATSGCYTPMVARYIYQDGEFGVVGIPVNNYQKRLDYRDQAEELMARHFPEGYEIVRAEEVNEGERIRDVGRKTEFEAEPAMAALNQIVRLGALNRTTSFAEKDKLQVRECRIIYKKKPIHTSGRSGQFAATTSLAPPLYIDPNDIMRRQIKAGAELLAKAETPSKKSSDGHTMSDDAVTKASGGSSAQMGNQPIPSQMMFKSNQMFRFP